MDASNRNIVTASGDSDPQIPAVGSEQVGSRRPSSSDHRTTGVDSKAPVSLKATSADVGDLQVDPYQSSLRALKHSLATKDAGYKLLYQKIQTLETWSVKLRSPEVKTAIDGVISVVTGIKNCREEVHKSFNQLVQRTPKDAELQSRSEVGGCGTTYRSKSTQTTAEIDNVPQVTVSGESVTARKTTEDVGTDTPCWWEAPPPRQRQLTKQTSRVGKPEPLIHNKEEQNPRSSPSDREKIKEGKFTVVNKTKRKKAKGNNKEPVTERTNDISPKPPKPLDRKRRRPPKTQVVVLEKLASISYADAVREVKDTVKQDLLSFEITTRRTKTGNLVLETSSKDHADNLASALARYFGDIRRVRRPSLSVALLLIGVEDSVDESVLTSTLEAHDPELKPTNEVRIREGRNGVRTAIVRVPLQAGYRLIDAKRLKVGWGYCRIKDFDAKVRACNKCKTVGHSSNSCPGPERRSCFQCRVSGHLIAACSRPANGSVPATTEGEGNAAGASSKEPAHLPGMHSSSSQ